MLRGSAMVRQLVKRVLVADDDPLFQKYISRHLVAAGYVVRTALDGLDAIARLRAGLPDLIISDLNMPGMSGYEFLEVVHKRLPQIPVILISAVHFTELPQGIAADAYCPKSEFIPEQLLQAISDLTKGPHSRTAPPKADSKPVRALWDENGYFIITCDDCFRECLVPRLFHLGRDKKWTICTHCGKLVDLFFAEDSGTKSDGDVHGSTEPPSLPTQ